MTLPTGISTCVVTFGRATSYLGTDATIEGKLTVDRPVVWAEDGTRIGSGGEAVPNDAGYLMFSVPHVDQDGFISGGQPVTGWLYTLSWTITYAGGAQEMGRESFQVFVGQTLRDLDLGAGAIVPAVLETAPQVTSVAGFTGAVTADDLAAAVGEWTESVPAGDGNLDLFRLGRLVQARIAVDQAPSTSYPASVPIGYRPAQNTLALMTTDSGVVPFDIVSDGLIFFNGDVGSGLATVMWITSDPDPS